MRLIAMSGVMLLAMSAVTAEASPLEGRQEIAELSSGFFNELKAGRISEAMHSALKSSERVLGTQAIDNVASGTTALLRSTGNIKDWSIYNTNVIADGLIEETYYVRCTIVPLFATLQFYKTDGGWHIIDVRLNTLLLAREAGYVPSGTVAPQEKP